MPKSDWFYSFSQRWRTSIQSAKTRSEADCGSEYELLVAKFRLKFKKIGKTARPFRYDLNQIPYDYTLEVTNRFKGLDLIDSIPDNFGWRFVTLYRRQGSRPYLQKRNAKKQNDCLGRPYKEFLKRREAKNKGEKERYKLLNAEFQRIARRDKETFLSDQ